MIIENRLEKRSFGPFGSSTGLFIFLGGLIIAFFSLAGIILSLIGAFVAFTSSYTIIDTEKRRIKHADYIFGLFPMGKWVNIQDSMKLGIKKVNRGYVGYIRGTQPMNIQYNDFRIFLYDSGNKQIMPIKKFQNIESAESELKNYESILRLK
jgi:hypothetical protein